MGAQTCGPRLETDGRPFHTDLMEHFTDEELAFLRHARFGELPPRVKPEDYVELVESELERDMSVQESIAYIQYRGQPSV